ncbi:MAG: FAD-binding protein [Peptococcaceae bacterium BRH_c8a]|nr:MAG: FAD-binding protein [Peptococcaceae bacterium BRH_c8a]
MSKKGITKDIIAQLCAIVGKQNVLTSPEDLVCYSYDAGTVSHLPEVVVIPGTVEEISQVMELANHNRLPVVPRGGGTNICGASIPLSGGMVMVMQRLNRIMEIDADNMVAVVQPAVNTASFHATVEELGLFYPPDPQSAHMSTIGGNVAQNAGGPRGLKFGVTRDYVLGLQAVLADGRILRVGGKTIKNVTGYDLIRLFTGSEGTLGIITEVTLRLIPLPETNRTMLAIFDDLLDGAAAVAAVIKAKIIPTAMELMDQETMKLVETTKPCGLPVDAQAVILIQVDGRDNEVTEQAERIKKLCLACGAREVKLARTEKESAELWAGRRAAFICMAMKSPTPIVEDATVPRSMLPHMVNKIKQIASKYDLFIPIMGHAGDGNLHPIICTDERNQAEMARVHQAIDEIFRETISIGGTLSGEHGIGLAKRKYIETEFGEVGVSVMRQIKQALDPNHILNPGKVFVMEKAK